MNITERVREVNQKVGEISKKCMSNNNPADLTEREARAYAIQCVCSNIGSYFRVRGETDEAEKYSSKAKRLVSNKGYRLSPLFSRASEKILDCIRQSDFEG